MKNRDSTRKVINARLLSDNETSSIYTILVKGKKISGVKKQDQLTESKNKEKGVLDARGKLVLPSMIDCHTHFFAYSLRNFIADLSNVRSVRELQARVTQFLERNPKRQNDEWLIGRGWDQDLFREERFPNHLDIDEVLSSSPVLLERICGHIGILNSKGLSSIRGLERFDQEFLPRDSRGDPTGLVKEKALEFVRVSISPPPVNQLERSIEIAQSEVMRKGLVSVHCILSDNWKSELEAIKELSRRGKLSLGFSLFLPIASLPIVESMTRLERQKLFNGKNYVVLGFKLFADGSLGARTAALSSPYHDDPTTNGVLRVSSKEISVFARRIKSIGLVLATHAIGDQAIEEVLKGYAVAKTRESNRFRIEHSSVVRKEFLPHLRRFVISVQPSFCTSDYWIEERLGKDDSKTPYPLKSLCKDGLVIGGSDSPVEDIDPLKGICAATTNPILSERLTVSEAVKLFTSNAAKASPITSAKGQISTGYDADIIILNISAPSEICRASPQYILHQGKLIFRKVS